MTSRFRRTTTIATAASLLTLAMASTAQAADPTPGASGTTPATASASPSQTATPRQPASKSPVAGTFQKTLDTMVAPAAKGGAPGELGAYVAAMGHFESPKGSWSGTAGVANLSTKRQPALTDQFRGASNLKPMVAVLALQEVEAGRWKLDTTVESVLPGLLPGDYGKVTLKQLLSHTSGIPEYMAGYIPNATDSKTILMVASKKYQPEELIKVARQLPWDTKPGEKHDYSNTNYVVAGMMVEKITGKKISTLLKERIFPTSGGMRSSYYSEKPEISGNHLTDYGFYQKKRVDFTPDHPSFLSHAGALVTTLADLESFFHALATGKLLKPETVDLMTQPIDEPGSYGMGLIRFTDRCAGKDGKEGVMIGHSGGTFGTSSFGMVSRDGTRRLSLVFTGRHHPEGPDTFKKFIWDAQRATCTGKALPNPAPAPGKPTKPANPSATPTAPSATASSPSATPSATPGKPQPTTTPSGTPSTAPQLRSKDLSVLEIPDSLDNARRSR
ncbi:putative D-alanyl-D-alanine carboxypeptidase [Austwickia sp. TVS 96-490-7B]|uniref:serine hydrolase domain-containing protein n=1 Tax=Austwickia sp. TVS 96-490-7B TaxID=2830843 RepID=UPI001C57B86A|nr:serine hydrolase domain-containing protein [Austwickia sp. TVS 96-490-7B]MBW3085199.1 putative D-alanyl-D-alanine carboxypeptidase [Austwickia sp. TVS 96-490-7B]